MYKISVCMITCNGAQYLSGQVRSILSQLREGDELVVCDDKSDDNSLKVLESFHDKRLKLKINEKRLGATKNLEQCLSLVSNDIIFLSDQDDIWFGDKVQSVLNVFEKNPKISLVISDAQVIDFQGNIIAESFFSPRRKFKAGFISNIIKNKYMGCAMAFKWDLLKYILPFPHDLPMHDMWIGIVNGLYGKTFYIDRPLLQYRRHESNLSPSRSANIGTMTKWRLALIKNIFRTASKHGFRKLAKS